MPERAAQQGAGEQRAWRQGASLLLHVRPHDGAHRVALRVGLSIAVPLLALQLLGRPEWSIYAAFGAFPSLYGRERGHLSRLRLQLSLAVLLAAAVTLGAVVGTAAARSWIAVPVAAVLAVAAGLLSAAQDWHPPGPLFVVFAFTACASVPADAGQVGAAAGAAAASAGFAVVVGAAGWVRVRQPPTATAPDPPFPGTDAPRAPADQALRGHVLRCGLAVAVSGVVATASGIGHPYWAMVSAVVPLTARDLTGQLVRGAHRLLGTLLGLGVAAALLALPLRGVLLVLVVVVLQMGAELLVGRNYGLALVFVTPLALLLGQLAVAHPPGPLLRDRGVETLVGVVVALLVSAAPRVLARLRPAAP